MSMQPGSVRGPSPGKGAAETYRTGSAPTIVPLPARIMFIGMPKVALPSSVIAALPPASGPETGSLLRPGGP
jgi:hypothetical protein